MERLAMTNGRTMTSRIPVSPDTHQDMKDFCNGLRATFDDTIQFLLAQHVRGGEDPVIAGSRLREEFERWLREHEEKNAGE